MEIYENESMREISGEELRKRKEAGERIVKLEETDVCVPVSKEVYSEIMRPYWKEHKRAQRRAECIHKKNCSLGNCAGCFRRECISDSLEWLIENGGIGLPNHESAEETCCKKLFCRELGEALNELDDVDFKIFEMMLDGVPERTIAAALGFGSKNTIRKRRERLRKKLQTRLEKFF